MRSEHTRCWNDRTPKKPVMQESRCSSMVALFRHRAVWRTIGSPKKLRGSYSLWRPQDVSTFRRLLIEEVFSRFRDFHRHGVAHFVLVEWWQLHAAGWSVSFERQFWIEALSSLDCRGQRVHLLRRINYKRPIGILGARVFRQNQHHLGRESNSLVFVR